MQFVNQKKWFYKRFNNQTSRIKLGFRNLYIFPNLFGLYWILTSTVLYILGINLENNFTIFICYLMITVFIISLFLTHFNIHGLELISTNQEINFVNSKIGYKVILFSTKYRNNIKLKFLNADNSFILIEAIHGKIIKSLPIENRKRGIYKPDIIYGESSSPLSLFTCWFYWKPENKIIVAPERKKGKVYYAPKNNDENSKSSDFNNSFGDELKELKVYKEGENKSLIHWKYLAKTKILLSKKFDNKVSKINWLVLNTNISLEKALENLSYEIYGHYKANNMYGVMLSKSNFINPSDNKKHYLKSMAMLASFKNEEI